MNTPKELGRIAQYTGINAPTLDRKMMIWMKNCADDVKANHMIAWWEGWYEALDDRLAGRASAQASGA